MSFFYNLKYRFGTFSIAEKIILINVVFFLLPMLLNVLFFLFKELVLDLSQFDVAFIGKLVDPIVVNDLQSVQFGYCCVLLVANRIY